MSQDPWDQSEVDAAIADYFSMLSSEVQGVPYNKTEHRLALRRRLRDRSDASVEKKHQNISAILAEHGLRQIHGYRPLGNYQALLETAILSYLSANPSILAAAATGEVKSEVPEVSAFDLDKYFEEPPPRLLELREPAPRLYGARQTDFGLLEMRRRQLGLRGEEFIVALERQRLRVRGAADLAEKVQHVSLLQGDGAGFDVLSFNDEGNEQYIEVKTTTFGKSQPFVVSVNEVVFANEKADAFRLYRVFHFGTDPRVFVKPGSIRDNFLLDPIQFRAHP